MKRLEICCIRTFSIKLQLILMEKKLCDISSLYGNVADSRQCLLYVHNNACSNELFLLSTLSWPAYIYNDSGVFLSTEKPGISGDVGAERIWVIKEINETWCASFFTIPLMLEKKKMLYSYCTFLVGFMYIHSYSMSGAIIRVTLQHIADSRPGCLDVLRYVKKLENPI